MKLYHKAEMGRGPCPYYTLGNVEDALECSSGKEKKKKDKDLDGECPTYVQICAKRWEPRQKRRFLLRVPKRSLQFIICMCLAWQTINNTSHLRRRSAYRTADFRD